MKTAKLIRLDQKDWYKKSFNVFLPLEIQGKTAILGRKNSSKRAPRRLVTVEGKKYSVPLWAIAA